MAVTKLSFREIAEEVEDYALYIEAEERMRSASREGLITLEKALEQAGVLLMDLYGLDEEID